MTTTNEHNLYFPRIFIESQKMYCENDMVRLYELCHMTDDVQCCQPNHMSSILGQLIFV